MSQIDDLRAAGFSDADIGQHLQSSGFSPQEIKTALGGAPAPAGPQPTLLDRAVASPIGRAIHDNIVGPAAGMVGSVEQQASMNPITGAIPALMSVLTHGRTGAAPAASVVNSAVEQPYQGALQNNRNTPGYADQRAIADKAMKDSGGSGFTDQMTSGFNPSLAGLGGLVGSGGSLIAPPEKQSAYQKSHPLLSMLDASNAMADAQQQGQSTYQQAHPLMSMGGNALGSLLMMPERGPLPGKPTVPSVADLKTEAGQLYDKVDQAGHIVSAPSYDAMVGDLQSKLANEGIDKTLHPNAMAAYDRLAGEQGNNVSFKGLDTLRKVAGDAISGAAANPADRRMGYIVQNHIDDFVDGLKPGDLVPGTGDPAQAVSDLSQARNLWSRASQADLIQKQIDKAGIKASANYSQSGMENALRQQFKSLALNDKAMARLSPDVRQAVLDVAKGSPVGNVLRAVGKYAPHGPVATAAGMGMGAMLGGVTGAAEGGMASMAVPMLGEAARTGATAMTQSAAQRAMDIAALGRLPQSGGAALQLPALTSRSRVPLLLPLMLQQQAQSQRAGQ